MNLYSTVLEFFNQFLSFINFHLYFSFIIFIYTLKSSKTKKLPRDNLTKSELEALLNLQKRNDIIITKADKGGAVIILDIQDYIDEANRQLNDNNNYEQLDFDPTELQRNRVTY